MEKRRLLGLTLDELQTVVKSLGMPAFTAKQIAQWVYGKRVRSIDEMTNLSTKNRALLSESFEIGASAPVDSMYSVDGTIKYLYQTVDHQYIESVYIPDGDRATLCVSSQIGCKMGCKFCMTGRQGFHGHLSVSDILNQIYSLPEADKLTNVVYMGQGEPFDNLENVLRSTEILTADFGWGWSPKRITVSTVGIRKEGLERFLKESQCHLAISMHNPIPEQRAQLMPAERLISIREVVEVLRSYDWSHQRRLSFEYIVFGDWNDSLDYGKEIVNLLRGLECRVNLIRFHQIPDSDLRNTEPQQMIRLRDYLTQHGVFTTIRASRGEDIYAACGLLSTKKLQSEQNVNSEPGYK